MDRKGGVIVETNDGMAGFVGMRIVPVALDRLKTPDLAREVVYAVKLPNGDTAQATRSAVELLRARADLRWTVGKDLPGTRIQALIADREGALCIGTNSGLVRWAGGKLEHLPGHRSSRHSIDPRRHGRPRGQPLGWH